MSKITSFAFAALLGTALVPALAPADAEATNHWFGPAAGARRATSLDNGATNHCLRLNVPVITTSSKDE